MGIVVITSAMFSFIIMVSLCSVLFDTTKLKLRTIVIFTSAIAVYIAAIKATPINPVGTMKAIHGAFSPDLQRFTFWESLKSLKLWSAFSILIELTVILVEMITKVTRIEKSLDK
ncbi:hypothetical protein [Vibrio sp. D431a]|uniref:hypothetical protein n=1 Tax=Vibrio sp. D431a TaxID=2837388 RepID=UPI0025522670|nr:hypothetical protein [Vibrio sp. D431a]MDK9793312.1 hypothetical protein [Vibrio sp. D431a]